MATNRKLMNRFDLTLRIVAALKNGEAVVAGIGNTNFDLWCAEQRPENFYMLGSMGLAVPIALGVALAQPGRRVVAIEGDGSMLMQLGSFGTIATLAPKNLAVVIMDNGAYQITGAQPTATSFKTDLVAIAAGAGIPEKNCSWAADEAQFEELLRRALSTPGPFVIAAKIDREPAVGTSERDPAHIRDRFMRGLGVRE